MARRRVGAQRCPDGGQEGAQKAKFLDPSEANATVAEVFPKRARVRWDSDGQESLCYYRRSTVMGRDVGGEARERAPVAVGDRVKVERMQGQEGLIIGTATRKNGLSRPAPGGANLVQFIVANLDRLVIVASACDPEFSPGLVDRFLVAASAEKIPCVLAVTKMDLLDPGASRHAWQMYAALGLDIVELSRKDPETLETLRKRLEGQTAAFCGHSGVGKTSLLERLTGRDVGAVGAVNDQTGKGRHTTSSAILLQSQSGSSWIDTPGIREFGLVGITSENLKDHFPELISLKCSIASCQHRDEEGCLAHPLERYSSYRRILEDLIEKESETA